MRSAPLREGRVTNLGVAPSLPMPTVPPRAQGKSIAPAEPQVYDKNSEVENIKRRLAYFRFELEKLIVRVDGLKS